MHVAINTQSFKFREEHAKEGTNQTAPFSSTAPTSMQMGKATSLPLPTLIKRLNYIHVKDALFQVKCLQLQATFIRGRNPAGGQAQTVCKPLQPGSLEMLKECQWPGLREFKLSPRKPSPSSKPQAGTEADAHLFFPLLPKAAPSYP